MTSEDVEAWMRNNGIRRVGSYPLGGFCVYLGDSGEPFGTGETIAEAIQNARGMA